MEDVPILFRLLLVPVLIMINAFFAAAEVALVSVRYTRMRQLADGGDPRARAVLGLLDNPDRLLSAGQLGVTLASLGLGWAGEDTVYRLILVVLPDLSHRYSERLIHLAAFALAFVIITYLHMVVGEVVPKNLALERSERLALSVGPAVEVFARVTHFFVTTVESSSEALSRLLGLHGAPKGAAHSVEELKLIVSASQRQGEMLLSQEAMLHRVIDFYDLTVRQVMVPRNEIVAIPAGATLDEIIQTVGKHRHSRLPVYEGSPEHVIGILYAWDLWILWRYRREVNVRALIHPHRVVPETKPVHQLLAEFQEQRYQMAMVVDEFGTIVGLVTMEDVIEQIVGEIRDEYELPEPVRAAQDAPLEIDGVTNIRDLENLYGVQLPDGAGFETLAGFLLERLGAIPKGGESVEYEGRRFTVTQMEGRRIARVRIEKAPETKPEEAPA